jgi:hypothetical protein
VDALLHNLSIKGLQKYGNRPDLQYEQFQFFIICENPFVLAQKPNKMGNFGTLYLPVTL